MKKTYAAILSIALVALQGVTPGASKLQLDLTDPERLLAELKEWDVFAQHYRMSNPAERERWNERLHDPHPDTAIPMEREAVEKLFAILESEEVKAAGLYWSLAPPAFNALWKISPTSSRLTQLAKDCLSEELPSQVNNRHRILLKSAVKVLLEHGEFEAAIEATNLRFWEEKSTPFVILEELPDSETCPACIIAYDLMTIIAINAPGRALEEVEAQLLASDNSAWTRKLFNIENNIKNPPPREPLPPFDPAPSPKLNP